MIKPLDPRSIPKYVNPLVVPPEFVPTVFRHAYTGEEISHHYQIHVRQFRQQLLPSGFGASTVYGYGGMVKEKHSGKAVYHQSTPGPTFEAIRGVPIHVRWVNQLTEPLFLPVDPTIHWANPDAIPIPSAPFPPFPPGFPAAQKSVPIVTHLHGGETAPAFDGNPDSWFTSDGKIGSGFVTNQYTYLNTQEPTTLWYHDHAMGLNRLTVYAGLAGGYIIRDRRDPLASFLPDREHDIPLIIQDRSFYEDGSLFYPTIGNNPSIHPYWVPEFFGDTVMVNGKVWPNLNVQPQTYRFRILNGSNCRFYKLQLSSQQTFMQIGSDGGYLPQPAELNSLLISPAERVDILIDFSAFTPGTKLIITNSASAPYPKGTSPDPQTVGQIMQFTVMQGKALPAKKLPTVLNRIPLLQPVKSRTMTLFELAGPNGPLANILDGQLMLNPVSELPLAGSTEDWVIANVTGDTHPIHLHLVQFLLVSRQKFRAEDYLNDWKQLNQTTYPGTPPYFIKPKELQVTPYLLGEPSAPAIHESGWKDTVQMNPGEVTIIRIRFAAQNGTPYPFDPSSKPGYVWHCHMIEHENNEMMRPYYVAKPGSVLQ